MPLLLTCHADTPCAALERIEVEIGPAEHGALRLTYRMLGNVELVAATTLPPAERPRRRDELWRHTCCELFVRDAAGDGYRELNFAPCGDWAAYRFTGYRTGMAPLDTAAPRIALERTPTALALTVTLPDQPYAELDGRRIGLACVVETPAGLAYWALAHPRGRPDFHHADAFAVTLAVAHTARSTA
ncbi:MAG TPA: DOMON-like domain-containing protein [Gammaproteobacteria bacterium]